MLFVSAGNPTLKSVADAAAARGRGSGVAVPRGLYARLGEWRSGKHLPREFDTVVMLVLAELLERAQARGGVDGVPARMDQWRRVWKRTVAGPGASGLGTAAQRACPYPGLASYSVDDAARFFGRTAAVEAIAALVAGAGSGLVAVVGVSGAGKSSVLAAGVRPTLAASGFGVLSMTPGTDPVATLARSTGVDSVAADSVGEVVRNWVAHRSAERVVIVVDQAEEALAADSARVREFMAALAAAAAGPVPTVVLIGLRADFLGQWSAHPVLRESMNNRIFVLGAMTRAELAEAITAPLRQTGLTMEPGLAEHIIDEFCGPGEADYDAGLLPLLNHALAATWRHRQGAKLTMSAYRRAGGVASALIDTAEGMWTSLGAEEQADARRVLIRLVRIGDGTRDTRQSRTRDDLLDGLPSSGAAALEALIGARLVAVDADNRVAVVHEVILSAWPRLRQWIADGRAELLALQKLQADAESWKDSGREPSHLYRDAQLTAARAATDGDTVVTGLAHSFIAASGQAARRAARARALGLSALVCVTVLALVLSVVALLARESAQEHRQAAELGELQARADQLAASDPSTAARLALLAYGESGAPEDWSRLVAGANLPLATAIQTGAGALYSVAVSPDGGWLAAAGADGGIRLWDISDRADPRPAGEHTGHDGFVTSVSFAPDGGRLASTSDDGTTRVWDRSGGAPIVLRGHQGRVVLAAWSPAGDRLVTGGMDGSVRVWDTATGMESALLNGPGPDIRAVAWSPDGRVIAAGGADRTVQLWNGVDYAPGATIGGHADPVHSIDFGPDAWLLATGSDDGSVRIWELSDPAGPALLGVPLAQHSGPIWSVDFAADGRSLLVASLDGTASVWDIANPAVPARIGAPMAGAGSSLYSAAFVPGTGHAVVTGGADGAVRLWSLPPTVLAGHNARVIAPAIAGDLMVSASYDGAVNLWDIADAAAPVRLDTRRDPDGAGIREVAISPDGATVATATAGGVVRLYRVGPGWRLTAAGDLRTESTDQQHAGFSPDGRVLLTSADDHTFRLWDAQGRVALGTVRHAEDTRSWATAAAWSPDSTRLATVGADHRLVLWDVSDPAAPIRLHTSAPAVGLGALNAVAWSPSGRTIATGGDDGVIALWHVEGDTAAPKAQSAQGPRHTVRSLTFTAGGERLVAAGDGQSLTLWDVSADSRLTARGGPLSLPGGGRWYATASADGRVVAAGGDGGSLQLTILDADYASTRICGGSGPLSHELAARNVPGWIDVEQQCP